MSYILQEALIKCHRRVAVAEFSPAFQRRVRTSRKIRRVATID